MGGAGRDYVEAELTWSRVAERMTRGILEAAR
jgi:hypothetical protein